jgi:hypothetical protein
MKTKIILLVVLGAGSLLLYGCAAVLIGGGLGVVGGIAISKDTVESTLDKDYERVWSAATKEIRALNGTISMEDRRNGRMEACIRNAHVRVTINQLTPKTVQVRIKARKNLFPDIDLANKLSTRIAERL